MMELGGPTVLDAAPPEGGRACWRCGFRTRAARVTCPRDGARLVHPAMTDDDDPLVAQVVDGRYVVARRLGEGGIAVVYGAHPTVGAGELALKVLKDRHRRDPLIRTRFMREARLLSQLHHPGVLEVHDLGELPEGGLYMVMERLDGESLHERHVRMPLTYAEILEALERVCAALEHVHAHGIVHGDIKPGNIHRTVRGAQTVYKLLDFGVARPEAEARAEEAGPIFGTPAYMSPEQAAGRPFDRRADLYALATTAYELIADRLPFGDGEDGGLARKMRRGTAPPLRSVAGLEDVPPALDELIGRTLRFDPCERPATAAEFAAEVRRARAQLSDATAAVVPALRVPVPGIDASWAIWSQRGRRLLATARRYGVALLLTGMALGLGSYGGCS